MTSPRTLDALLAERLFGWTAVVSSQYADSNRWISVGTTAEGEILQKVPHYSSTWEGLGLVSDALRAKGWDLKVYVVADSDGVDAHVYRTGEERFYEKGPRASTKNAPLSVALAALRALGVSAEEISHAR